MSSNPRLDLLVFGLSFAVITAFALLFLSALAALLAAIL